MHRSVNVLDAAERYLRGGLVATFYVINVMRFNVTIKKKIPRLGEPLATFAGLKVPILNYEELPHLIRKGQSIE